MITKIEILKQLAEEIEIGNGLTAFSPSQVEEWKKHYPNLVRKHLELLKLDSEISEWVEQVWGLDDEKLEQIEDIK